MKSELHCFCSPHGEHNTVYCFLCVAYASSEARVGPRRRRTLVFSSFCGRSAEKSPDWIALFPTTPYTDSMRTWHELHLILTGMDTAASHGCNKRISCVLQQVYMFYLRLSILCLWKVFDKRQLGPWSAYVNSNGVRMAYWI